MVRKVRYSRVKPQDCSGGILRNNVLWYDLLNRNGGSVTALRKSIPIGVGFETVWELTFGASGRRLLAELCAKAGWVCKREKMMMVARKVVAQPEMDIDPPRIGTKNECQVNLGTIR